VLLIYILKTSSTIKNDRRSERATLKGKTIIKGQYCWQHGYSNVSELQQQTSMLLMKS